MNGLLMQNSLLKQVEQKLERQLKPSVRDDYLRIVVAGMETALAKGPNSILASLGKSHNPVSDVVNGVLSIVGALRNKSKGTMPTAAMIPACMTLILHGLDYADKIGLLTVTATEIDHATHLFSDAIFPLLKITPDKMSAAIAQVHQIAQDPAKVARLKGGQNGNAKLG